MSANKRKRSVPRTRRATNTAAPPLRPSSPEQRPFHDEVLTHGQHAQQTEPAPAAPTFRPASLPLGATVPPKVKTQIWACDFVELGKLESAPAEAPMAITIANGSSQHTVSISSPSQEAKISNIDQWTDLFLIYTALLTEHYPLEAPHLMKYCSVVRSLAKKCTLQG